jgi:hypothetical protein
MRMFCAAVVAALVTSLAPAVQASVSSMPNPTAPLSSENHPLRLAQGVPSDVEQRRGIRPNSARRDDRGGVPSDWEQHRGGGVPSDWEQHGYGRRNVPSNVEQHGYRSGDRRSYCEQRGLRRGLDGREFRRFVRDCMDR